jgi:hypothetical protein
MAFEYQQHGKSGEKVSADQIQRSDIVAESAKAINLMNRGIKRDVINNR